MAETMAFISRRAFWSCPFILTWPKVGRSIAARIPMIAATTNNSTRVKPIHLLWEPNPSPKCNRPEIRIRRITAGAWEVFDSAAMLEQLVDLQPRGLRDLSQRQLALVYPVVGTALDLFSDKQKPG